MTQVRGPAGIPAPARPSEHRPAAPTTPAPRHGSGAGSDSGGGGAAPLATGLRRRRPDLAAVLGYLAAALYVTGRLWRDPDGRVSGSNPTDATLFEWMLAHSARAVSHLENPLVSTRLNTPSGMNVMANTSILGLGVPLSPITLALGPSVSYLLVLTIGLAGTAVAWYFVLSRYVTTSRLGAFVGGALCGFCPGMISQGGGHLHIVAQFLMPLIVAGALRLRESTRPVRDGVILGLLIAYQVFIGEEILFVTVLLCLVVVLGYLAQRPGAALRSWRPFATGLGVAALVALVIVAYPLYVQFLGPQTYQHVPGIDRYGADVASYLAYSPLSLGGDPDAPLRLARNATELNTFFGWPLLLVTAALAGWLRRHLMVRLAALVVVVFGLLSLGKDIRIDGENTGLPGPWRAVTGAPLFESVVASRLGMVVAAGLGLIIAVAVQELRTARLGRPLRLVVGVCLAGALLPVVPRPLPAAAAIGVPSALADGGWRRYLSGDQALMPVPPSIDAEIRAMSWTASEGLGFRVTHGHFLSPDPRAGHGWATFNTLPTATDRLLNRVAATGEVPRVTERDRAQAREDLRLRDAGLLVMPAGQRYGDALRSTVDALVGPGRRDGDAWLWDVRSL